MRAETEWEFEESRCEIIIETSDKNDFLTRDDILEQCKATMRGLGYDFEDD